MIETVRLTKNLKLRMIDQTRLPEELIYVETNDLDEVFDAIKRLVVRGAPAIGCAAAIGLAVVAQKYEDNFYENLCRDAKYLNSSRPTAVNLSWALDRCLNITDYQSLSLEEAKSAILIEAKIVLAEDLEMCKQIGKNGVHLFERENMTILTHCNAGALATGDYGTALSPVYTAHEYGLKPNVFADETRPLLQGSRLTAWELERAGVPVTVICDSMAAQVMREGKIDFIITGADRIASNGDTANKIGTYGVAILAAYHNIPLYVAAPYSTFDFALLDGSEIPIEERDSDEVSCGFGKRTAPKRVNVYNPAFDVTPAELISGFITDCGFIPKEDFNELNKYFK